MNQMYAIIIIINIIIIMIIPKPVTTFNAQASIYYVEHEEQEPINQKQ